MLMLCCEADLLTEREPVWPANGNANEVTKAAGIDCEAQYITYEPVQRPAIGSMLVITQVMLAVRWQAQYYSGLVF
jgi:hypothetical protein